MNEENNKTNKKKSGNKPPLIPTIIKVETDLSGLYDFRYNEVKSNIEFRTKGELEFILLDEKAFNSLWCELNKKGIACSTSLLINVLKSDFIPVFNPFKEFFGSLPVWDGETDYIQLLAETVETTDDDLWHPFFKKWLVAAVGSVINDAVINHSAIVLSGPQGIGKTTWLVNLLPKELLQYYYSGTINPNNKDTLGFIAENFLVFLDELENLNRNELGSIKELITKPAIKFRRPYARTAEDMPHRASFAGSVNHLEFLGDITGSRRFLCFEVVYINYKHGIDLKNVYAQALHLYNNDFKYWFSSEEIDVINNSNEQFRLRTMEEELLRTYFEPCVMEEADLVLSTTDVALWFQERKLLTVNAATNKRLGQALRALSFLRLTKNDRKVYALKEKDLEMVYYNRKRTA